MADQAIRRESFRRETTVKITQVTVNVLRVSVERPYVAGVSIRIQPLRSAYTTASVRSFTSSFLKIALT